MTSLIAWKLRAVWLLGVTAVLGCASGAAPECLEVAPTEPLAGASMPAGAPDPRARTVSPEADTTMRIILNVPAYSVRVFDRNGEIGSYYVAVGSPKYPTRVGSFTIQTITWNPWWNPPPSDWARTARVTPPGPDNPMGKVKINYTSAYFLHGTPDSTRLRRAVSHGCVRMQNADAIDLALTIQDAAGILLPAEEQARLLTTWRDDSTIALQRGVPFEVRYDIAEVRDSMLFLYRDIYDRETRSRDAAVFAALAGAHLDAASIDSTAVREFVQRSGDGGSVVVRALLRSGP